MKTKTIPCLECGKKFEAAIKELKRGYGKFCTRGCSGKYNGRKRVRGTDHWPTLTCDTCGVEFKRSKSKLGRGKSRYVFCGKRCKDEAQRLDGIKALHPDHYHTGSDSTRYRLKALRAHGAACNRCGYNRFEKILDVHHRDRNRRNNHMENLEILCRNCHDEEHLLAGDGKFGGRVKGSPSSMRKLTREQARDIRQRYEARKVTGELMKDIAAEYGVTSSAITKIGRGQTYAE